MNHYIKYLKFLAVILIIGVIGSIIYTVFFNQKRYDNSCQEWMVENIQNNDAYKFHFDITTEVYPSEQNPLNEAVNPYKVVDYYSVTVFKNEKQAIIHKISHIQSDAADDKYRIYYVSIVDDSVKIYIPEKKGGYSVKTFAQQNLADAVEALLFPKDVSFFQGDVTKIVLNSDFNLTATRMVDSEIFYKPFEILAGKNFENEKLSMTFVRKMMVTEVFGIDADITSLYAYAYEVLNGVKYTNEYEKSGLDYKMTAQIYFDRDFSDVEIVFSLVTSNKYMKNYVRFLEGL